VSEKGAGGRGGEGLNDMEKDCSTKQSIGWQQPARASQRREYVLV
jgi:hypothetical protein